MWVHAWKVAGDLAREAGRVARGEAGLEVIRSPTPPPQGVPEKGGSGWNTHTPPVSLPKVSGGSFRSRGMKSSGGVRAVGLIPARKRVG